MCKENVGNIIQSDRGIPNSVSSIQNCLRALKMSTINGSFINYTFLCFHVSSLKRFPMGVRKKIIFLYILIYCFLWRILKYRKSRIFILCGKRTLVNITQSNCGVSNSVSSVQNCLRSLKMSIINSFSFQLHFPLLSSQLLKKFSQWSIEKILFLCLLIYCF